jgi:hypothetical protein
LTQIGVLIGLGPAGVEVQTPPDTVKNCGVVAELTASVNVIWAWDAPPRAVRKNLTPMW